MKSLLIKWFMPSAKTLSGYAAKGIAKGINGLPGDKKAVISKYSTMAANATELANKLAKMVEDGTIDDAEEDELAGLISPVMQTVVDLI